MAIARPGIYDDEIDGVRHPLCLRNGEIERFEEQYAPLGIYEMWDRLLGRGAPPQSRHVRDLVALGLVGGGMSDREADRIVADLGPDHLLDLREVARRLLGVTFMPSLLKSTRGKKTGWIARRKVEPGDGRYDAAARIRNICGVMGRLPAEVRAMTPEESQVLVEGWNAAQADPDAVEPPTRDELDDLIGRYGP